MLTDLSFPSSVQPTNKLHFTEDPMTKFTSHVRTTIILLSLALICPVLVTAQSPVLEADLGKSFSEFSVADISSSFAENTGEPAIRINYNDKQFVLDLTRRDLRSRNYRAETTGEDGSRSFVPRTSLQTFRGTVASSPGSAVRLSISSSGEITGQFMADGDLYIVEPALRYSMYAGAGEHVVYRTGTHLGEDGIACETEYEKGIKTATTMVEGASLNSGTKVLKIATEADLELVNSLGSVAAANEEILSILNVIEGTYEAELNLVFSVVYQHAWTTQTPYANTTPNILLTSFRNHWQANFPPSEIDRDIAYYFTGKANRAGSGISQFSQLCNPNMAYGLSGDINNFEANSVLMAHEIAHILGANHADSPQGCANTLMNQTVSNLTPLTFCSYSQSELSNNLATNGSCLDDLVTAAVRYDFDGDSRADVSVFRPSNGVWYINGSAGALDVFQFGQNGDEPVSADYDGDGVADAAVYRNGAWYSLNSSDGAFRATSFGYATDIPVPGDYDGDGKADLAVYRPSNGTWYSLRSADGSYSAIQFGANGDQPVAGDYDGDGTTDLTVFRPSNGTWYRINSSTGAFYAAQFGQIGDVPLHGEFDGDGLSDLAVWRPSNGGWYVLHSSDGSFSAIGFGIASDIPVPADYDGDGKTDRAIFRTSDGYWHFLSSGSNNSYSAMPFGSGSDLPVPSV